MNIKEFRKNMKKCFYCDVFDVKFDKKGKWLEGKCKDIECCYCSKRPKNHPKDCRCNKERTFIHRNQIKRR